MKKRQLQSQLDAQADAHFAEAKRRYDQANRLLQQADALLSRVEARYRDIERTIAQGEKIESDSIDPQKTRGMIRYVAMCVGVEETSPGRFVGGYEAIVKRIHELCDIEDKAGLLTVYFNVTAPAFWTPSSTPPGLFRDASADYVRARFVEISKHAGFDSATRDRLALAVSESRRCAEAVERATRLAAANDAGVVGRARP